MFEKIDKLQEKINRIETKRKDLCDQVLYLRKYKDLFKEKHLKIDFTNYIVEQEPNLEPITEKKVIKSTKIGKGKRVKFEREKVNIKEKTLTKEMEYLYSFYFSADSIHCSSGRYITWNKQDLFKSFNKYDLCSVEKEEWESIEKALNFILKYAEPYLLKIKKDELYKLTKCEKLKDGSNQCTWICENCGIENGIDIFECECGFKVKEGIL